MAERYCEFKYNIYLTVAYSIWHKGLIVFCLFIGINIFGCTQFNKKPDKFYHVESELKIYTDLANKQLATNILKHLDDHKHDVRSRFKLVKIYLNEYFFESAIQELERIITIEPNNIEAHSILAFTLIKSERTDLKAAIKVLKQAVSIEPNRSDIYIQLALVHVDLNLTEDAIVYCYQALKFSTEPKQQAIAHLLLSSLDKKEAGYHYQESLRLDPSIEYAKNGTVRVPVLIQDIPWMNYNTHPDPLDRIIQIDELYYN